MSRRRPHVAVAILSLVCAAGGSAAAYSHLGTTVAGTPTELRWEGQPRWYAGDRAVPGVSATQFQSEVEQAFAAWADVPTASITFRFGGFTSAPPEDSDGLSVFGFEEQPDLDRVLAATSFVLDVSTGEIVESDVFFNTIFPWSVSPSGDAGRYDLRSVATHEIGHFIGIGHSAIGETELRADGGRRVLASGAVMFPISLGRGVVADRALQPDDVAAVSDLYPDADTERRTGIIAGRVMRDGAPVSGAHVVAFNTQTGALIGGFTRTDGTFRIARLTPGPHVIRVEPLDDADVDSFLPPPVDVDFQVTFHPRLVVAPAGGAGPTFDVIVRRR
jgi:hypothetical protein